MTSTIVHFDEKSRNISSGLSLVSVPKNSKFEIVSACNSDSSLVLNNQVGVDLERIDDEALEINLYFLVEEPVEQ